MASVFNVCIGWRRALMSFPRPFVLNPIVHIPPEDPLQLAPVKMELLVPTALRPHDTFASRISEDGGAFRYMALPVRASLDPHVRYIGGTAGVPLFIDGLQGKIVISSVIDPLVNHSKAEISIQLPVGLEAPDVYFGIVAPIRSSSSNLLDPDLKDITGVFLVTRARIFGFTRSPLSAQWARATMPVAGDRRLISATSVGGVTYVLDHELKLSTISVVSGEVQLNELNVNINRLLDRHTRPLRTWLLHVPIGEGNNENILVCLRYELSRPRYYRFVAYYLAVQDDGRAWRFLKDVGNCCIFVGWGAGAEAFAYRRPEGIGLMSDRVYGSQQGLISSSLNRTYTTTIMPPPADLTWPFPFWLHQYRSPPLTDKGSTDEAGDVDVA